MPRCPWLRPADTRRRGSAIGGCIAVEWHVQYRQFGMDRCLLLKSYDQAVETACRLLHDGVDVYGIGTALGDSVRKTEIARIYAQWLRAHPA